MKTPSSRFPWPTALPYLLFTFVAFMPCWLTGRSYFDNDLLAEFGPFRQFLRERVLSGHFPLWIPYHAGGQPFLADPQNLMFYPFNWPTLLLPLAAGLTAFFMLHSFWAGLGMHLWLRSLGAREEACLVGGLLFSGSGFFWMEIIHPPVEAAYAWLPWLFLALELLAQGPSAKRGVLAGLAFAQLFLAGSFQVFLGGFYGGLAYFGVRSFSSPSPLRGKGGVRVPPRSLSRLILPFLLFLWGSLPLLCQFIPTAEFSALCTRRAAGADLDKAREILSLLPSALLEWVFPRASLKGGTDLIVALQSLDQAKNLWIMMAYAGIWAPFLAFWAFRRKDPGLPALFLGLSLAGLALALGHHFPLHSFLYSLPGIHFIRVPFRFLFIPLLGLCVLAALGYDRWMERPAGSERGSLQKTGFGPLQGVMVYAFLLYLFGLFNAGQNWRELATLGLGTAGFFLHGLSRRHGDKGRVLLVTALVLPLFLNGWDCFKPEPSSNFDYRGKVGMLQDWGRDLPPQRVFFWGDVRYPILANGKRYVVNFPENASCVLGLRDFGGYNPLKLSNRRELQVLPFPIFLQLGAIRALVTQGGEAPPPGFREDKAGPFRIFRKEGPLPSVFAPDHLWIAAGPWKGLEFMASGHFDPYRTVVLSRVRPDAFDPGVWEEGPAKLDYHYHGGTSDTETYSVRLDKDKLAVFCEIDYPGWKAFVDGRSQPIQRVDHALRGLFLKKGGHKVEFRYEPDWWPLLPIGLAAWMVLTVLGWVLFRSSGEAALRSRPGQAQRPAPTKRKGRSRA